MRHKLMLLRFLRGRLHRRGRDELTYRQFLQGPLAGLVSSQIGLALADGATRIAWGLPPGAELTEADKAEIVAHHEQMMAIVNATLERGGERSAERTEAAGSPSGPAEFRRRDGLPELPCWRWIDGRWCCGLGVHPGLFPYLPQHLCERLVSLDSSPREGGREEWIEYTSIVREEDRQFVRVDLVLEANASITLELLESRVQPPGAAVWWRQGRV